MNRRGFIRYATVGGGLAIGGGVSLFVRHNHVRAELKTKLLNDALPSLEAASFRELQTLPIRARDEIRRFFHGKCLNVEGFVNHICSNEFSALLRQGGTQQHREECLMAAFCRRVATENEILNQVEIIATEVGNEIDANWSEYCGRVTSSWNANLSRYGTSLSVDDFTNRVGETIRDELTKLLRSANGAGQKLALGDTVGNLGKSAVLLFPLIRLGHVGLAIGVPVFVCLAAQHIWNYVLSRLEDPRHDLQIAISSRLALLGNRVGAEFEREVRLRLTDLHTWQIMAVQKTAQSLVEERISLF